MEEYWIKIWIELKPHLVEFVPFLSGLAVGLSPSLFREKQKSDYLRFKADGIKVAKRHPVFMMDETKRKSLQPANHHPIPAGWDLVKAEIERDAKSKAKQNRRHTPHTPPMERNFEHKFFGSQLTVEGTKLIGGLSRGKHTMEIVGNQMFIDNDQVKINEGDLERIKDLIRKSRI